MTTPPATPPAPAITINATNISAVPVKGPDGQPGLMLQIGNDVAAARIVIDAGNLDAVIAALEEVRRQGRGLEVVHTLPDELRSNGARRG